MAEHCAQQIVMDGHRPAVRPQDTVFVTESWCKPGEWVLIALDTSNPNSKFNITVRAKSDEECWQKYHARIAKLA